MSEVQLRSPLAVFWSRARKWNGSGQSGVQLSELSFREHITLRAEAVDLQFHTVVQQRLGVAPPTWPNRYSKNDDYTILWSGPNEWLVIASRSSNGKLATSLASAMHGTCSAVVDVSHNQTILRIRGPKSVEVLRKGCSLDLHAAAFAGNHCTQTLMAKVAVVMCWVDAVPTFDLIVRRSYAEYLALWVEDAAQEYGIAIG
jgi:sarcosine oxidase subunit gamma